MATRPAIALTALTLGPFETNCWIVADGRGGCLVVDPGDEVERIRDHLEDRRLVVLAYVLTHGHVDHVSALAELVRERPAPIAMHPADATWAFTPANSFPPLIMAPADPGPIARELIEGGAWVDGGLAYTVLATPGHTPGSVCLYFERDALLITGDTLFAGGMGRTDLPGGNSRAMVASLARLGRLDPEITIFPGHGPTSTIGREREGTIRWAGSMI
jgi:glyoxylase-like metal-dependent hydrolase (beta-lactamase superfamily II)